MEILNNRYFRIYLSLSTLFFGGLFSIAHAGFSIDPNDQKIRGRLWPNKTIPYVIKDGFRKEGYDNILASIAEYNTKTVIKFIPRTNEAHYLVFTPWDSMNAGSGIGMQLGPQVTMMDRGVWRGTVTHELGHAIGLYHEHNRPDVDQYFAYRPGNPDTVFCKDQYLGTKLMDGVKIGTYDYLSIMNYFTGCVVNSDAAIVRTKGVQDPSYYNHLMFWPTGDFRLGTNLSQGDIDAIKALYSNAPKTADWDYTSCVNQSTYEQQCQWMIEMGSCTAYSTQQVSYQDCAASCGICKVSPSSGGSTGGGSENSGGNNGGGSPGNGSSDGNSGGGNNGGTPSCSDKSAADFCLFGATVNFCNVQGFASQCQKTCGCAGDAIPSVMKNSEGVEDNPNCLYWAVSRCDTTLFVQRACPASCATLQKYRSEYSPFIK